MSAECDKRAAGPGLRSPSGLDLPSRRSPAYRRRRQGSRLTLAAGVILLALLAILSGYFLGHVAMQSFLAHRDAETVTPPPPAAGQPANQPASQPPAQSPGSAPPTGSTPPAGSTPAPGSAPPAAGADQSVTRTVSVRLLTLYRVQVGAFASPQNAAALVEELTQRGFAACACPGGPPYRVAAAATSARDAASFYAAPLTKAGYEVYVRDWVLNPASLKLAGPAGYLDLLAGGGSDSSGALAEMTALAARWGELWAMWASGDRSGFAAACPDIEARARAVNLALNGAAPPAALTAPHARLLGAAAAAVRAATETQALAKSGDPVNQRAAMLYYMEFVAGYEAAYLALAGQG